jgi:hypothetical protein
VRVNVCVKPVVKTKDEDDEKVVVVFNGFSVDVVVT